MADVRKQGAEEPRGPVYLHDDEHSLYRAFISALETRWNVEDEGELTDLLGIEFTREDGAIELRQTKYMSSRSSPPSSSRTECRPRRRRTRFHVTGICPL